MKKTSQFLIELFAEYKKDVEISLSRFKEFDELDSNGNKLNLIKPLDATFLNLIINNYKSTYKSFLAEFIEIVEMYKMDLENEL
jgi:hypothetical protein